MNPAPRPFESLRVVPSQVGRQARGALSPSKGGPNPEPGTPEPRNPGTRLVRSRWILPIDRPPIENGWIEISDGRIASVGSGRAPSPPDDLGDAVILPGLVNSHTHLELSWLHNRIPPSGSLVEWIRQLIPARAAGPAGGQMEELEAMSRAAVAMHASGTVLVGDISNTLLSPAVLSRVGLGGTVFHELLAFSAIDALALVRDAWARVDGNDSGSERGGLTPLAERRVRPPLSLPESFPRLSFSVVAHAPYSVAPALFAEIARRQRDAPLSVHLGESPEEIEFLRTGSGPFRRLLEDLGVWTDGWTPPRCDPVEYLHRVGYLRAGMLAVHGVHLTDDGLGRLRDVGAVIVTCPRSNTRVGAGLPRVSHFYGAGVPVAIGTDSLASAPTLNMFDELAELRRIAPDVSAASMLDSATRQGARALGFGRELGTVAVGKRAALLGVSVPADVTDVEEYLVSGVPADLVRHVS